jgi:transcriptional regulator GlxA family with amidase domain
MAKACEIALTRSVSANQFAHPIRIETARCLLETARLTMEEIARRMGDAEPSAFRRPVRRDTMQAPGHFRPAT